MSPKGCQYNCKVKPASKGQSSYQTPNPLDSYIPPTLAAVVRPNTEYIALQHYTLMVTLFSLYHNKI